MIKTPLQIVQEKFGDKTKLVEALRQAAGQEFWVENAEKTANLVHVSNAKLLRLHSIMTAVKEKFSSRAGLVDAILQAEGRSKDMDHKTRLLSYPVPRLFDMWKNTDKRAKAAGKKQSKPSKAVAAKAS